MANGLATGTAPAATEPPRPAAEPRNRRSRWLPASALEFIGCTSCRMTLAEYEALDDDARVEMFDVEAGRVWRMADGPDALHEKPLARLGRFLQQVAMVRGSPIELGRGAGLHLLDADRRQVRTMHPDEMVFLDPEREERIGSSYTWGADQEYPDVVLEVDNTTDVRRNKLLAYADWGFPEVWVEVPEAYTQGRRRRRPPGLTIYVLESGAYRESAESRAFPGLLAEEAHRVLNERIPSPETAALASRVGRALGLPDGTGPDDDPLLREQRAEVLADANAATARTLLRGRGYTVSAAFPDDLPAADRTTLAQASPAAVAVAALNATSATDFLHRLRDS